MSIDKSAARFAILVALRVRAEATAKGITGKELSKRTGVGAALLSNYFRGKREMPLTTLGKCCIAIGTEPRKIVDLAWQELLKELEELERPDFSKMAAHRPGYSIEEGYEQQ